MKFSHFTLNFNLTPILKTFFSFIKIPLTLFSFFPSPISPYLLLSLSPREVSPLERLRKKRDIV